MLSVQITTTYPSVYYFSFVGTMPWQQRTGDGVGWARFMIKNISYLVMAAHVSLVDFKRFGIFDKQNVPRWLREGQSDGKSLSRWEYEIGVLVCSLQSWTMRETLPFLYVACCII